MNLPNALTLLRIFIVPLLVVVLLTPFAENWLGLPRHILGVALFLGAALTDYLDGHLARRRDQVTRLGQLLDPIADKLLISAALISLVENQLAPAWAVVIIIGREFAVTGLRSIAAADGVVISASKMGKFKMLAQVVTVALLIVSSVGGKAPQVSNFGQPFPAIEFWSVLGRCCYMLPGERCYGWWSFQLAYQCMGTSGRSTTQSCPPQKFPRRPRRLRSLQFVSRFDVVKAFTTCVPKCEERKYV